jgi:hypothetical protein
MLGPYMHFHWHPIYVTVSLLYFVLCSLLSQVSVFSIFWNLSGQKEVYRVNYFIVKVVLPFDRVDIKSTSLWNVSELLPNYMALHLEKSTHNCRRCVVL